jgi:hypothetical protein
MWAAIIAVAVVLIAVAAMQSQPRAGNEVVVVELFTSQGCSSCPPADALLSRLRRDPRVIPLAYHVDYWNRLGWTDPFSSREWSQRQGEYIRAMKLDSAYTPQMVINGRLQMVGSHSAAVQRAIDEESKRKRDAKVTIARAGNSVNVLAETNKEMELIVVAYENGIVTKIEKGENRGRTQTDDAIARKLVRAGTFRGRIKRTVSIDRRLGVVAFLQDPVTKEITAAASRP